MSIKNEIKLVKSQFIQALNEGDQVIIWHSLFGKPKVISREVKGAIELFSNPKTLNSLYDEYEVDQQGRLCFEELLKDHYLVPQGFDERNFLTERIKNRSNLVTDGSLINNLELIMSEACNFRCIYCIHFNNLEASERIKNPQKIMSFEVARETVDSFLKILGRQGKKIARSKVRKIAEINFGGGEPLLAWPVIEKILDYCRVNYSHEFIFKFSINTNASLLTSEIAKKLKEYRVDVASSLDGLCEGNNMVRLTKYGDGTFDSIVSGFAKLEKEGYPIGGFAITINGKNFAHIDERIIDWAIERCMREIRIDIDVINMIDIKLEDIIEKLLRLRRYAQRNNIYVFGFWSRPAENMNESTLEINVAFCGAVRGNSICVNPAGNIYSCGYSTTQLGTLSQLDSFCEPEGHYHCFVRGHFTGNIERCRGCMIEGQCGGGCNITQEFAHTTNSLKIERMCEFYRLMTRELLREQLYGSDFEV